jgi:hypothetical protein
MSSMSSCHHVSMPSHLCEDSAVLSSLFGSFDAETLNSSVKLVAPAQAATFFARYSNAHAFRDRFLNPPSWKIEPGDEVFPGQGAFTSGLVTPSSSRRGSGSLEPCFHRFPRFASQSNTPSAASTLQSSFGSAFRQTFSPVYGRPDPR